MGKGMWGTEGLGFRSVRTGRRWGHIDRRATGKRERESKNAHKITKRVPPPVRRNGIDCGGYIDEPQVGTYVSPGPQHSQRACEETLWIREPCHFHDGGKKETNIPTL